MGQGGSRLRFAVLDASHRDPNTRRNFRRELDADLAEFDAAGGELPTHYSFDGVVVTGSRSSVYWDEPWIESLVSYVSDAHAAGLPILGVCYGHQVLATALGGRVEGMGEYELGYREVRHSGDDLFEGVDESFTVFTTHSDTVVELPPGAELVAENDYGVHAFRNGHAWGVQFHPEYDRTTAESVTRGKDLPEERIESVVAGIDAENYEAACEAKRLFDNFVSYAARVRDEADGADESEATV
ncbi:GMP synthase (glutamine-hydrolysing) [Halopelagius inordinatus]|uniref:GMP synthase (Glutamine-hydrolysing) n=1 Tax=Halopelagius inordinatus TaxID=553467 RepID=A0A1I2LKJ2_9EURY|nr:type 1 glutamine amidotransferase [Halopelagius inordinatus]SFF80002.1 GMP synthase (glutamine-hydrolysing) [Halopelagius inordinatus]